MLGRRAGLTDAELDRVREGPDAPGWSDVDADLLRVADELHENARIGAQTFERLARHFDHRQIMDMVFVVGCYAMLGMAIGSFNVPLEDCNEPLDPALRSHFA